MFTPLFSDRDSRSPPAQFLLVAENGSISQAAGGDRCDKASTAGKSASWRSFSALELTQRRGKTPCDLAAGTRLGPPGASTIQDLDDFVGSRLATKGSSLSGPEPACWSG